MAVNPSLEDVAIGDIFLSSQPHPAGGRGITYISTVTKIDVIGSRFNKRDRIIYVDIAAASGNVTDRDKPLWHSQLCAGLV